MDILDRLLGHDSWTTRQLLLRCRELFVDYLDNPPTKKSYGGAIAHIITHSMHHRAQVLYMLRLLGVKNLIEGDVLSWENHERDNC